MLLPNEGSVVISCMRIMRPVVALGFTAAVALFMPQSARAINLEQACARFAGKLNAAQSSGDSSKAQAIYQEGTQRIASRFNGASCPNVKPPTP